MRPKSNSLVVERLTIDSLRPMEGPIRHHPKTQFEKLCRSVAAFGQVLPIPITPEHRIIDLEQIWRALKNTGATHVDVVVVAEKSPAAMKALRLMLNRTAADAVWDNESLRDTLCDLAEINFELDLTGFDPPEIDFHLGPELPQANVEENACDIPPLQSKPVSSQGTIWTVGDHRIGCGNATDLEFVNHVLEGRQGHVAFVDPPYNIAIRGFVSGKGRNKHRNFLSGAGELSQEQFFALLRDSLQVLKASCRPTALIYACIDWRHVMEMTVAGRACGMPLYQIITWVKSNAGMGGIYRNASEFITVFRAGNEAPLDNVELGRRGRNRTNVWHYPSMSAFGKQRDNLLALHPTVKPVAMIADALRDVSRRGEVLIDTFLGSGTSLMAAQETGRVCCGVELDPLYVDVAIRRWQNITGREATNLETGEPFARAAQRLLNRPADTQ